MKIRKIVELCSISALQRYFTVKILEEIIEFKSDTSFKNIEIVHNLVLRQNVDLLRTQKLPKFMND